MRFGLDKSQPTSLGLGSEQYILNKLIDIDKNTGLYGRINGGRPFEEPGSYEKFLELRNRSAYGSNALQKAKDNSPALQEIEGYTNEITRLREELSNLTTSISVTIDATGNVDEERLAEEIEEVAKKVIKVEREAEKLSSNFAKSQ